MLRSRSHPLIVLALAGGALAAAAPAAVAQQRGGSGARQAAPAAKPFLDVRDARRGQSRREPSTATRSARTRLRRAAGVVEIDELTGTPRVLGAPLTGPSRAEAAHVAARFLRDNLPLLGLTGSDLGSLRPQPRVSGAGGTEEIRFRQYVDGIPAFDNALRVNVARDGRVQRVLGAPQHALALPTTTPRLSAAGAMRRLREDVGTRRAATVERGPEGVLRRHVFADGDTAELVAFGEGESARLGWQLSHFAGSHAWYAAVVDAVTGDLLYRANRTKAAVNDARVWEQYPGAANGGTAVTRSLTPYLDASGVLSGPNARLWSDVDDDFFPPPYRDDPGPPLIPADEDVSRNTGTQDFVFTFDEFTSAENPAGGCAATARCSWNFDQPTSWRTNRAQSAVQTFYLVNRFHDHLEAAPISFSSADGNFEGVDRVLVNSHDGAGTAGSGGPNRAHLNNAFMATPPDGSSPIMGMFLFFNNGSHRDVNGGDDAAIVYHEYTHGLSSRLVTVAPGGEQALNKDQAGAIGEGWSDWYAKDFLVGQFPADDDPAIAGEVDMGEYTDSVPHTLRSQALDCPVGAAAASCPASGTAGAGGYTYGDYGRIAAGAEVHADGEIWAQTLWDLRGAVGSPVARTIVTEGMRLTPAEPTFLEARDGILAADRAIYGGAHHGPAVWQVFAGRGMGTDASAGENDAPPTAPDPPDTPVEGFNRPPSAALKVAPGQVEPGEPVGFDASDTVDPDGSVVSYRWDFDGNGTIDATTAAATTTFAYAAGGTFTARVTAIDEDGGAESAEAQVRVNAPPPPTQTATPSPIATPTPTVAPPRNDLAPALTLPRSGRRGRVRIVVSCDSACSGTARLTVSRRVARKLGLGRRRTVGSARVRLTGPGQRRFTIRLTRRTVRALRRARLRRLTTSLAVSVADVERQRTRSRRTVRVRR